MADERTRVMQASIDLNESRDAGIEQGLGLVVVTADLHDARAKISVWRVYFGISIQLGCTPHCLQGRSRRVRCKFAYHWPIAILLAPS